jgi:hypothetical protein
MEAIRSRQKTLFVHLSQPRAPAYDRDMTEQKRRFRERSPAAQLAIVVLTAVSIVIVAIAERDLQRRPASQVRGKKLPWRIACTNALPAVIYLRWGRRTGE